LDVVQTGGTVWVLREYDCGVPVARLAAVAAPTALQVRGILRGGLEVLAELHAAGITHGGVRPGNILAGADGSIRLVDAGIEPALEHRPVRWERRDVASLVSIATALWRPSQTNGAGALFELLRSGQLAAAGCAQDALQLVTASADENGAAAPRASLATLVARVSVRGQRQDGGRSSIAAAPAAVTTRRRARLLGLRQRPRPVMAAAAAVVGVVMAAGVLIGLRLSAPAGNPGKATTSTALQARIPAELAPPTVPATPTPRGSGVLTPSAPSAAGIIAGVELTQLDVCELGQRCQVQSQINLQAHDSQDVSWNVVAVDRCTGDQSALSSSSIVADPSFGFVWDTDTITLPAGRPVLLYAVTTAPLRVASAPAPIGSVSACG
ncbi:MAG: hypothetical protein ABR498_05305, partial [Candidatus Dormibacteria bacterium]